MTTIEIDERAAIPLPIPVLPGAVGVRGKFFSAGGQKHFVKGVTYGPFAVAGHGAPFPARDTVDRDFAMMSAAGVNTVRVFTPPPQWLLDAAAAVGLRLLIGLPWAQHIAFLDGVSTRAEIRGAAARQVRNCAGHPAVFAYLVGNEIPPDIVRWHGIEPVRRFLRDLVAAVREEAPHALVSYANFPSTEYLTVDFTDFLSFNVYLHEEAAFRRYIARLHNLAGDRPLVLTEFGVDSLREGAEAQRRILGWQVRTAYETGVAGAFVFAWTDEWFADGCPVEDWAFGLVDRTRRAKLSLAAVEGQYRGALPPQLPRHPRVSVIVCAYDAERTINECLASLAVLSYPDYEIVVVNDGSRDRTRDIAEGYACCRVISQPNLGLGAARNVGAEAATGEIVAYTDSDCIADPDWLTYLVAKMEAGGLAACGGPNLPPSEDCLVPAAVAVAPGSPTHVLISDEVAEHIAGCNMAFRRTVLLRLGGFDPVFHAAGDDIDICWRCQDAGYTIGFAPAAIVWHYRRNTVAAYLRQQRGYGKAEALVYSKHPLRFNLFGQAKWLGRVYGGLPTSLLLSRAPLIYSGVFGRGLFQTLYEAPSPLGAALPLTFEWSVAALALAGVGFVVGGWSWLLFAPLLATLTVCVAAARRAPIDRRFAGFGACTLVAMLIYLGPLLRGWERARWRLREMRAQTEIRLPAAARRARLSWSGCAFETAYWSEEAVEKETLLGRLAEFLVAHKYIVAADNGWSGWDLEVAGGLCGRALVLGCVENHGGRRRLLRVRCRMRLSGRAAAVLTGGGALLAASLLVGWLPAAIAIGVAGLAGAVWAGSSLFGLARRMHCSIETAAAQVALAPLEPEARAAAQVLRPV